MTVESLKKEARRHEQREEWIKALDLYLQAIEAQAGDDEPDIALHNRVGDIQVRLGDLEGAIGSYERAITLYLSAELPNNAIAICRKIIRQDPERPSAFLRMGQVRAKQGFIVDARQNFLTYAEMMQARGETDEAFRALEEFAGLAPSDVETRLFLGDQLVAKDRPEEALHYLSQAYRVVAEAGDEDRKDEVMNRIHAIDPDHAVPLLAEPESSFETEADLSPLESEDLGITSFADSSGFEDVGAGVETELKVESPDDADGLEIMRFGEFAEDAEVDASIIQGLEATGLAEEEAEVPEAGVLALEDDEADDDLVSVGFELEVEDLPTDPEGSVFESEDEDSDGGLIGLAEYPKVDELESLGLEEPTVPVEEVEEEALEAAAPDEDEIEDLPLIHYDLDEPEGGEPVPEAEEDSDWEEPDAEVATAVGVEEEDGSGFLAVLTARVKGEPTDAEGWRLLGEELFSRNRDDEAWEAMENAHRNYAAAGDPETAMHVVRELLLRDPHRIDLRQRVVEYAHRTNERTLLVQAFLELAEGLRADGEGLKASAVFEQVLELDPGNLRANEALADGAEGAPAPPPADSDVPESPEATRQPPDGEDYVDLGAMVLDAQGEETTRWKIAADAPTGDEEADFARMLSQFKEKVAENLPGEDARSHYDLGAAYKDMGLLQEAIGEFQQALRAQPENLAAFEMLGQCFLEQGEAEVAIRALERGLDLRTPVEDDLLGVYYWLGQAHETVGNTDSAREFYEKIFSLDINFKDVTERLKALR